MEDNNMERKQKKLLHESELSNGDLKKSFDNFASSIKKTLSSIRDVIVNNEKDFWVVFVLAIGTLFLMIYLFIKVKSNLDEINSGYMQLQKLEKYNIDQSFRDNEEFKSIVQINELVDYYNSLMEDKLKYENYLKELSTSYEYLLQYIYLPRLNIWKDLYVGNINIDMIGIKFLENNPYSDSALVDKWTSFFQDVGENNESNKVLDISIGDFVEDELGFFKIPITLSFESSTKRSFLLLLDKLLVTSNQENVGLVNEFMYYLIQNIKEDEGKQSTILTIAENLKSELSGNYFTMEDGSDNINKIIGYSIYNWIYGNSTGIDLIDDSIIDKTVKDVSACEDDLDFDSCYYRFRDKYRNIPEMAYNLGRMVIDVDRTLFLKNFLKKLPPIISIRDLSFNKIRAENIIGAGAMKYRGKIVIDVFGKGISSSEVDEISMALGKKCFASDIALNAQLAISKIDEYINKLSGISDLDFSKSKNMRELKDIISKIDSEYPAITNYNKIIKLFEIYRMLDDSSLCSS